MSDYITSSLVLLIRKFEILTTHYTHERELKVSPCWDWDIHFKRKHISRVRILAVCLQNNPSKPGVYEDFISNNFLKKLIDRCNDSKRIGKARTSAVPLIFFYNHGHSANSKAIFDVPGRQDAEFLNDWGCSFALADDVLKINSTELSKLSGCMQPLGQLIPWASRGYTNLNNRFSLNLSAHDALRLAGIGQKLLL
ncbi:hypothetical protein [Rhodobacter capsulatus]|uniref:hypothetical protein n=1 Tax=Rhodobacter capsulatus TaxID=1061 RepID=UPI004026FFCA